MTGPSGAPRGAPAAVRRLTERLAGAGTPLVAAGISDPSPGDQLFYAPTHVGTVCVWSRGTVWGVTLAPQGTDTFVDVGVWDACVRGQKMAFAPPPVQQQVEWVEQMLDQPSVPAFDRDCLRQKAAERAAQLERGPGAARIGGFLLLAAVLVIAMMWGSAAFDLPILRVMAAFTAVSVMVGLGVPLIQRARRNRRNRR